MTTDTFYETDFITWTERQAMALREAALREAAGRGSNLPVDWEHLAEEVQDLGSEVLDRIQSLTRQIVIHILELACSPAELPRRGRQAEIDEFRTQLQDRLATNHAVRARFGDIVEREFQRAAKATERSLSGTGEDLALAHLDAWKLRGGAADEVLQDGLYPVPGTLTFHGEPT